MKHPRKSQRGIGLPEFLIGLLIASVLMTLLIQQYLSRKQHYQQTQTMLEDAFELELVRDLIRNSVKRAGFTPCVSLNVLETSDNRETKAPLTAFEIHAGVHSALRIQRMSEKFSTVLDWIGAQDLLIQSNYPYRNNQSILIADCYHAEVQTIVATRKTQSGMEIRVMKPFIFHYVPPIYLGEWVSESFFTQKNKQQVSSLFYQANHAEELTPLVKNISTIVKKKGDTTLLQVTLALENNKNVLVETQVRAG